MAAPAFVVVGNPGHRRLTLFQAALAAQALPPARELAWLDLAVPGAPARLLGELPDDIIFRLDSTGEDDAVERALLNRGEQAARAERAPAIRAAALSAIPYQLGRILYPRQHHLGFLAVLDEIEAAIRPSWRVVQPVSAIRELFDKRITSRKWRELGIPVPEALDDVRTPDELRRRMREAGWSSVFVKVASSSSASCLALYTLRTGGEHAVTTVEDTGSARYNTRRLQHLRARPAIDRLLAFLLAEGAQVERAIDKARSGGRYFDLRVLTIDDEPAFVVMRTSPHPITNLHLGGQRGDVAALRQQVPPDAWDAAMASCCAVQRASGAFHVGVDLMFEPGLRAHRVIEGNAFGDLLPNLERDGLDVYGWQIRRLLDSSRAR
ncbi:MAG TPA: STM4014 family protein [Kofleriaceae bacterium]|nr:STM4014 family protein [Kofleriaceae bacterium]